jgi:hypothetical protein
VLKDAGYIKALQSILGHVIRILTNSQDSYSTKVALKPNCENSDNSVNSLFIRTHSSIVHHEVYHGGQCAGK